MYKTYAITITFVQFEGLITLTARDHRQLVPKEISRRLTQNRRMIPLSDSEQDVICVSPILDSGFFTGRSVSQMYFQLDGFNSQLKWAKSYWDDNGLANIIAGPLSPLKKKNPNGNIELVLGLKQSGASHLLISSDDAREISSSNRLPYPHPSSAYSAYDFESISPIIFQNIEQLSHKLRSLKPKSKKAPGQANRNYADGSLNLYRAAFEHGRVFYQILNKIVDPRKYGVDDAWIQRTRVLSFVFNVKGLEFRNTEQRKLNPDVLDIGICEALLPALAPNFSTAIHITNRRNKLLGKNQPKMEFSHGTSEDFSFEELPQRIQSFFKDYQGAKSRDPIILLVCRQEESLNLLRNFGVDTSGWRSGIRDLLLPDSGPRFNSSPQRQGAPFHSRQSSISSNSYSPTRQRHRSSRSRSPDHLRGTEWGHGPSASTSSSSRYQYDRRDSGTSSPTRQSYAPVYVLDVRELYVQLMQVTNVDGVTDIARFFKLTHQEGWCAGNESATIINIWKEMASSLSIDEQRELRKAALDPASSLQVPGSENPEPQTYVYDEDDDRDPYEIVAPPQKGNAMQKTDDPYDFDESDASEDD